MSCQTAGRANRKKDSSFRIRGSASWLQTPPDPKLHIPQGLGAELRQTSWKSSHILTGSREYVCSSLIRVSQDHCWVLFSWGPSLAKPSEGGGHVWEGFLSESTHTHSLRWSRFTSGLVQAKHGLSQKGAHFVQLVLITNYKSRKKIYLNVCYMPDMWQMAKNTDFYFFSDTTAAHFLTRYKCVSNGRNHLLTVCSVKSNV